MAAHESRYELAGVLEAIPSASDFVAEAALAAGLDERDAYHCQLAVDEACTNIIEHGNPSNGTNGSIQIICRNDGTHFIITILDNNMAFNPLERGDPDPSASLEQRKVGGWGIYFIKKLMDDVSYTRNGNHNQLTMRKRINQARS